MIAVGDLPCGLSALIGAASREEQVVGHHRPSGHMALAVMDIP